MYLVVITNTFALGYTHLGSAPGVLTMGAPLALVVACVWRLSGWWRLRNRTMTADQAARMLNGTVRAAVLLSIGFALWSLSLLPYGNAYQQSHVGFFMAITVISCIFCLMYLPAAALIVTIGVLGPMTIVFGLSDESVFHALALNVIIVAIAMIAIMRKQYRSFADLVESRQTLAQQASRAEELSAELRRNQAELKLILDNIPTRIFYKDDENRILRLNKSAADWLGKTVEEVEGASTYDIFPEFAKKYHDDDLEVIESGKPKLGIVEENARPNGEHSWARTDIVPYLDEATGKRFVFIAATDSTPEKLAQDELLTGEQRHRSLYKNAPVMMHLAGPDQCLSSVSDLWLENLGYTRDEVIGRPVTDFMTQDMVTAITEECGSEFFRPGFVKDMEIQLTKKSGEELDVLASAAAEYGEEGEITGAMVVFVDITARKIVEGQLLQSQKMESVGQLTGGLAHDFNNLLGVIIGNLELVEREVRGSENASKRIAAAANAADRGAELTRRLLAFSRRQALETEVVDPIPLIENLRDLLNRTLGEATILECKLGEDVPSVRTDPSQLESALLNLAVNARDAMPQGGKLTIESNVVSLDEDMTTLEDDVIPGDYVVLAVSDTGVGIPANVLARVFEPFFTTKEVGKGSGLGLSMVYGFMKQSGGHVRIHSQVGQGTTVSLYLPVDTGVQDIRQPDAVWTDDDIGGWETILVVEDQSDVREVAVGLLEHLGYKVIATQDAEQALAALKSDSEIDLLFTDIVMPGKMDGKMLGDAARALRANLPIVFTTGYADAAVLRSGEIKVASNLVTKPYRKADLAAKIRRALDSKGHPASSVSVTA